MHDASEGSWHQDRSARPVNASTRIQSDEIAVTVQSEPWLNDESPYISLTQRDLSNLAEVMAELLRQFEAKAGDRVLVYDFSTSITTLAMSRLFAPGLKEGACEKLGCTVICTDGLSELASRTAYVFNRWKPTILVIRSDLISVFRSKLPSGQMKDWDPELRSIIVCHNDMAPWPGKITVGKGEFSRFLLYKADLALFLCAIKPCGGIYVSTQYYEVCCKKENTASKRGHLAVKNRFESPKASDYTTSLECESDGQDICECKRKHDFRTVRFSL